MRLYMSPWISKGVFPLFKVADTHFHIQGEQLCPILIDFSGKA